MKRGRLKGLRQRRHDVRGYGGNIGHGYRIVRKGGRIKFDNFWHSHPKLAHLVGFEVLVYADDAFYSEYVSVHHETLGFICRARNEWEDQRPAPKQDDEDEND